MQSLRCAYTHIFYRGANGNKNDDDNNNVANEQGNRGYEIPTSTLLYLGSKS
jgi:hypothetical protein